MLVHYGRSSSDQSRWNCGYYVPLPHLLSPMALRHACGIHLVLVFYGHWALDQWPQWPSALKPCPSWAQTPSMTATFPACISSRPSMSQTGFSAPKVVDSHWSDMSVALKRGVEFINKVLFPGYSRCWNGKKKTSCHGFWTQSFCVLFHPQVKTKMWHERNAWKISRHAAIFPFTSSVYLF